jgi:sulfatase maturation enzyme AslB (radical SAM superfamily)
MDAGSLIKNKSICALPWTGFQLEPNGDVKNCIISKEAMGNINDSHIKDIVNNNKKHQVEGGHVARLQATQLFWLLFTRKRHEQDQQYQ